MSKYQIEGWDFHMVWAPEAFRLDRTALWIEELHGHNEDDGYALDHVTIKTLTFSAPDYNPQLCKDGYVLVTFGFSGGHLDKEDWPGSGRYIRVEAAGATYSFVAKLIGDSDGQLSITFDSLYTLSACLILRDSSAPPLGWFSFTGLVARLLGWSKPKPIFEPESPTGELLMNITSTLPVHFGQVNRNLQLLGMADDHEPPRGAPPFTLDWLSQSSDRPKGALVIAADQLFSRLARPALQALGSASFELPDKPQLAVQAREPLNLRVWSLSTPNKAEGRTDCTISFKNNETRTQAIIEFAFTCHFDWHYISRWFTQAIFKVESTWNHVIELETNGSNLIVSRRNSMSRTYRIDRNIGAARILFKDLESLLSPIENNPSQADDQFRRLGVGNLFDVPIDDQPMFIVPGSRYLRLTSPRFHTTGALMILTGMR